MGKMIQNNEEYNEYKEEIKSNLRKSFTVSDLEYICKYIHIDGAYNIALALGRTKNSVVKMYTQLKKENTDTFFRNLNIFW
ncbi:hypothetical protein [Metabacillus niabensis]|uniref:hypothetical protein n=1 Tax=Metabacillus niabensis TaxID=324854 RepID=UPI0039A17586